MKKFLSLVLALVMTMSLVTISAGAKDFTDDSKITYEEAVDVMSAVKVIDGYEDGSFNPTATLTRGAAAKIICNMILGPTTASALVADTAPYSDVPTNHTFAGYIAYCAQQEIISGYADGTFRPGATLTSYAFMKMLLGALGYDAAVEGYTGSNWSVQVAKRALAIGLDDDLEGTFNGVKAVTREEACLYAFNTLKATMVEYDTTITIGDVKIAGSKAQDVENNREAANTIKRDGKMQFAEKFFSDLKQTSADADDFGRPAHEWKYKKTVIGLYAETPDAVYTESVKGKAIYGDLDNTAYDFEDIDGTEAIFVDGVLIGVDDDIVREDFEVAKSNDRKIGGNGVLVEAYIMDGEGDEDDTVRIVMVNTYVAKVTSDYDKDDEELEIDIMADLDVEETLELDDLSNIKDFEEDDYVLVTIASDDATAEGQYVASIEMAEKVTAAVTNFEGDYNDETNFEDKDTVTAGEKYSYSRKFATEIDSFDGTYVIKDEYDFYLDSYGYVIMVDGVEAASKYVYIDGFEASGVSTKASLKAYGYFTDGTSDLISIDKVDGESIKGTDATDWAESLDHIGLYTYTEKNGKYKLTSVETNGTDMVPAIQLDEGELTGEDTLDMVSDAIGTTIRASKNTVFIIIDDDDDVEVYTGVKNVPVVTVAAAEAGDELAYVAVAEDDDSSLYAKYVFIDLGDVGSTKGRAKGGDVLFLYEDSYSKKGTDSDENVYHTYKVIKDGKTTSVKFDEEATDLTAGLYVGVKYDENGYACDWTQIIDDSEDGYFGGTYEAGTIEKKGDVITVWVDGTASEGFYMADDCKVTFIYDEDVKSVSWKNVDEGGKYVVDAIYGAMNDDDEYTELFIMVSDAE